MIGAKEMLAKLKAIARKFPDYVAAALYQIAQEIMTEAKRRCPVDQGILRASGRVSLPVRNGNTVTVMLSFGGAANAYALAVHEHPSEHSPESWRKAEETGRGIRWSVAGTGPHFLSSAIDDRRPTLLKDLAEKVNLNRMAAKA
jgi:hypothetical protein